MKIRKILWRLFLSALVIGAGFAGMQAMASLKKDPPKEPRVDPGSLVSILKLQPRDRQIRVWASGTVQARRTGEIIPQVSGRVIKVSPGFAPGGFFKKGDLLFRIESVDYELMKEKSKAAVAKAEYELSRVESNARVARLEWERIRLDKKRRPNPLVLYEPQLKNARAALASAKADLKRRRLDIKRTFYYAPYNCRIRSESIDPGQYVSAGKSVGRISSVDIAEIVVPVSLKELKWLSVPRNDGSRRPGSTAEVSITVDGNKHTWQGKIHRSLGEVDPKGRMIRLVVRVEDPYGLKKPEKDASHIDLAEGLFVEAKLSGKTLDNVYSIPAGALREESTVWIMGEDSLLKVRKARVIRREKDTVFIRGDVAPGESLVLTYLAGAAEGEKLRLAKEG